VKYRPTDAELLDAIATLLEEEVLPVAPAAVRHKVRVAANLARILERQQALEPEALERERARIAELLGGDDPGPGPGGDDLGPGPAGLVRLRAAFDRRIRAEAWRGGEPGDFERRAWEVLVATARDDVAVAKPGHDSWEGE
jgi:hypothetical protein